MVFLSILYCFTQWLGKLISYNSGDWEVQDHKTYIYQDPFEAKDRRLNDFGSWRSEVKEPHLVRSFLLHQSMVEGKRVWKRGNRPELTLTAGILPRDNQSTLVVPIKRR